MPIKDDGLMFNHSLNTLIGGQGRNGLHVVDLYEDYHFGCELAPTYIATRAIKYKTINFMVIIINSLLN